MTLEEMCVAAARYSDRYDEFERTLDGDDNEAESYYEDDALHYFYVFREAINEAQREISRMYAMPDRWAEVTVDENQQIDLTEMSPGLYTVKSLLNSNKSGMVDYTFDTKYILNVQAEPESTVNLFYHFIPDDLVYLDDEPFFTEAQADPMVYICLAVARMWYSEKKFDYGDRWMAQYQMHLREIKSSLKDRSRRRIPRGVFR